MVKNVFMVFDDKEYEKMKRLKDRHGWTWKDMLRKVFGVFE